MAEKIDFYLAQYLRDPIRREPKNVGLFVARNGEWRGLFLGGEKLDGDTDLRTITWTEHPKIYRKWVRYWREELETGGEDFLTRVMETNGGNYDVIHGGHITQPGNHTAAEIVANLFSMLVLEPKQEAALDETEEADVAIVELKKSVTASFKDLKIYSGFAERDVKKPIYADEQVMGRCIPHHPAYMQPDECAIELINFATKQKKTAKEHAGHVVAMFDDILALRPSMNTIAIVQSTPEAMNDKQIENSMKWLQGSAKQVIRWQDVEQRKEFLEARRAAAYRASA